MYVYIDIDLYTYTHTNTYVYIYIYICDERGEPYDQGIQWTETAKRMVRIHIHERTQIYICVYHWKFMAGDSGTGGA